MADYELKDWLTFEEAAAWLSSKTSKEYTANAITRAVMKGRLLAYFWPIDAAKLGLYTNVKPLPPGYESVSPLAHGGHFLDDYHSPPFCIYEGPVPIIDYQGFKRSVGLSTHWPVGLTVLSEGVVIGGCYRVGANDEPVSVAAAGYLELIHAEHLEAFLSDPNTPHSAPDIRIQQETLGDQSFWLVSCATPAGGSVEVEADQPPATHEQPESEAPALKALAFAAYLIADLSQQLDAKESIESQKLKLAKGDGSPNVSRIAEALEGAARRQNYDERGYGMYGFRDALRKALKTL